MALAGACWRLGVRPCLSPAAALTRHHPRLVCRQLKVLVKSLRVKYGKQKELEQCLFQLRSALLALPQQEVRVSCAPPCAALAHACAPMRLC